MKTIPFLASRRLCCSLAASICILTLSQWVSWPPSDTASASEPPLLSGLLLFNTLCCDQEDRRSCRQINKVKSRQRLLKVFKDKIKKRASFWYVLIYLHSVCISLMAWYQAVFIFLYYFIKKIDLCVKITSHLAVETNILGRSVYRLFLFTCCSQNKRCTHILTFLGILSLKLSTIALKYTTHMQLFFSSYVPIVTSTSIQNNAGFDRSKLKIAKPLIIHF